MNRRLSIHRLGAGAVVRSVVTCCVVAGLIAAAVMSSSSEAQPTPRGSQGEVTGAPPRGTGATGGAGATGTTPADTSGKIPLWKPPTSAAATTVPAAPKPIPNTLKSKDVLDANDATGIANLIQINLKRLVDGDADASGAARGDIIAGSAPLALDKPATVGYLTAYLNELTKQLTPLAKSNSPRVRVNVAIILARVLENTKAASIAPPVSTQTVIVTLMQDRGDAVALWGMRAAGAALTVPNQAPPPAVLKQIIPTVQAHNLDGAITDEAYSAVAVQDANANPDLIATLKQLFQLRVAKYKDGATPDDPSIDRRPAAILTAQAGVWSKMNEGERAKVMNQIADLLEGATSALAKTKDPDMSAQLMTLITKTSEAVYVVAGSQPNMTDLKNDSKVLSQATNPASIPSIAPAVIGKIKDLWKSTASTARP